jgi:hypothetical protein
MGMGKGMVWDGGRVTVGVWDMVRKRGAGKAGERKKRETGEEMITNSPQIISHSHNAR